MVQLVGYSDSVDCLVDLENYHNRIVVYILLESIVVNIHLETLLSCLPISNVGLLFDKTHIFELLPKHLGSPN